MRRFAYRLALKLGKHNVDQMLRELTAEQFLEWQMYAALEPFDEVRQDQRIGSIVQILANIHRGKSSKAIQLEAATLKFGDYPRQTVQPVMDWREMKMLGQIAAAQSRKEST